MHAQNARKCKDKTFSISHHSRNCMPDHIYKSFTAILNFLNIYMFRHIHYKIKHIKKKTIQKELAFLMY